MMWRYAGGEVVLPHSEPAALPVPMVEVLEAEDPVALRVLEVLEPEEPPAEGVGAAVPAVQPATTKPEIAKASPPRLRPEFMRLLPEVRPFT